MSKSDCLCINYVVSSFGQAFFDLMFTDHTLPAQTIPLIETVLLGKPQDHSNSTSATPNGLPSRAELASSYHLADAKRF